MIFYVLYATATGQIDAWGGTLELSSVLVPQGYALLETPTLTTSLTHYVADGALVAHPPEKALATARAQAWERIKSAREAYLSAPLATPFGPFDAKPQDRSNIVSSVLLAQTLAAAGQPVAIAFTLADNTSVTLDATQMVAVGMALGAKTQAAYAQGRALRTQIDVAAEPDSIAWSDPPPG